MAAHPTSSIQVIDRLAALLGVIAQHPDPVSLKVLAAETGLHSSTAHRILDALVTHGYVERVASSQYTLGKTLLHFASRVHGKVDLLREAKPIMDWLRSEVGESVNLTVREGDEVVYVERALPNRMMRVEQVIGSRAPLHVTAVGKLFLAEGGDQACREYARRSGLKRYTSNTFTQVTKLWAEAQKSQRRGYALDNEEAELGVACIGVAVLDNHGVMVAGLSISAPRDRRQDAWIPLLKKAGEQLSARLGFRPASA
jgi:IclR family transcriptional regulator, acetate operon repressor